MILNKNLSNIFIIQLIQVEKFKFACSLGSIGQCEAIVTGTPQVNDFDACYRKAKGTSSYLTKKSTETKSFVPGFLFVFFAISNPEIIYRGILFVFLDDLKFENNTLHLFSA
jgi:hypothetical protein